MLVEPRPPASDAACLLRASCMMIDASDAAAAFVCFDAPLFCFRYFALLCCQFITDEPLPPAAPMPMHAAPPVMMLRRVSA